MSDDRDALRAWLALLDTANTVKKQIDGRMRRQFGLSLSRFDVLAALDRAGPGGMTASELSGWLKVTDGNTTQVTAPLIEAGLVSRRTHADDRRVAILALTDRGQEAFDAMATANRRWVAQTFAGLSDSQLAALRHMLAALRLPGETVTKEDAA